MVSNDLLAQLSEGFAFITRVFDGYISFHPLDVIIVLLIAVLVILLSNPTWKRFLCSLLNFYVILLVLVVTIVCVDSFFKYFI